MLEFFESSRNLVCGEFIELPVGCSFLQQKRRRSSLCLFINVELYVPNLDHIEILFNLIQLSVGDKPITSSVKEIRSFGLQECHSCSFFIFLNYSTLVLEDWKELVSRRRVIYFRRERFLQALATSHTRKRWRSICVRGILISIAAANHTVPYHVSRDMKQTKKISLGCVLFHLQDPI